MSQDLEGKKVITYGRAIGISLLILGALIAIGPWTIFPVCDHSEMVMKCYYTALASIVVGSLIFLVGILLLLAKRAETKIALGALGAGLGVWTALIPTALIGVCEMDTMNCVQQTAPALIALGTITLLASIVLAVLAWRNDIAAEDGAAAPKRAAEQ